MSSSRCVPLSVASLCVLLAFLLLVSPVAAGTRTHPSLAKVHQHDPHSGPGASSRPHPAAVATPETRALWARIHKEMAARNYSVPTPAQLEELGYAKPGHGQLNSPMGGTRGVDVSSWIGEDTWTCIKNNGYVVGIAREFQETCYIDPNGVHTVANGYAVGMAHMDVYLFPSYGCSMSPEAQVDAVVNTMGDIPFGKIWLDVEDGGQGAAQNNMNWVNRALAHTDQRLGAGRAGVYSSNYEWGLVMGGMRGPTNYPLWYAHYDGNPSFSDWGSTAFGGWGGGFAKQFAGDASMCGASVDLNVFNF
jgi:GH25 family lysozyme M1 (1,4-beta-N-acetylmuramidase)